MTDTVKTNVIYCSIANYGSMEKYTSYSTVKIIVIYCKKLKHSEGDSSTVRITTSLWKQLLHIEHNSYIKNNPGILSIIAIH